MYGVNAPTPEEQKEMEQYLNDSGINVILRSMVAQLCLNKPPRPVQFMVNLLKNNYLQLEEELASIKKKDNKDEEMDQGEEKEPVVNFVRKRRNGVSSEPLKEVLESSVVNNPTPKCDETRARLDKALKGNIICSHLDESERKEVFDAMFEEFHKAGEVIIRQGDEDGDQFYVVDDGECDVFVEKDGVSEKVQHVTPGGSFGELALIYNTPRAATVIATTDVRLWSINRVTYRKVLMDSTTRKRTMYEEFLDKVPILRPLLKYERLTVADALEPANYGSNEVVVRQGEPGDVFYIIVEGTAQVLQTDSMGIEKEVAKLGPSDYFGEIALLTDRPRAATVIAVSPLKCVKMDRERFNRVLGPCEDILRRNMEEYNAYMAKQI